MTANQKHRQSGVSLVELAISIAIIGLLIALVVSGFSLMHSAELRKTVTEFTNLKTSIKEFEEEYRYLPGDLPTATNFWGAYDGGPPVTGAHNGDGNSMINTNEDLYAWRHLKLAELTSGSYTGTVINGSTRFGLNVNAPASNVYTDALFRFYAITTPVYDNRGHAIRLGTLDADGLPNEGIVAPKDAYALDVKLDDGIANSGIFFALNSSDPCVDGGFQYDLDVTTTSCNLLYWYRKF